MRRHLIFVENVKGVFLLEDLEIFTYNVMDAKIAHCCSRLYEKRNQIQKQNIQKNNLKRWKREFKKNLDETIKEGRFKCLVRIPHDIQSDKLRHWRRPLMKKYMKIQSFTNIPEEEAYGSELFVEWLKEKGYQVEIDLIWFVIEW